MKTYITTDEDWLILKYQKLIKKEKMALIEIPDVCKEICNTIKDNIHDKTMKRISVKELINLFGKFSDKSSVNLKKLLSLERMGLGITGWNALRDVASKLTNDNNKNWLIASREAFTILSDILILNTKSASLYSSSFVNENTSRDDLRSMGIIGLARAAELYVPGENRNFFKYAIYYITDEIYSAMRSDSAIIIPKNKHGLFRKIKTVRNNLEQERMREIEPDELIKELIKLDIMSEKQYNEIQNIDYKTISLNQEYQSSETDSGAEKYYEDIIASPEGESIRWMESKSMIQRSLDCIGRIDREHAKLIYMNWEFFKESTLHGNPIRLKESSNAMKNLSAEYLKKVINLHKETNKIGNLPYE